MSTQNNGRIAINTPDLEQQFKLYDKIPAKTNAFSDAMRGNYYETQLSDLFFSSENQLIVQYGIRAGVYDKSNNKFVIGPQNHDTLQTIMRSIFLQNSKNLPDNITQQIKELNEIVIEYAVEQIYGEATGYVQYKKDISTLAVPLDLPKMSRETKHVEFKKWF